MHMSSFRIGIVQNSVPGCSTVTQVSEEQRGTGPGAAHRDRQAELVSRTAVGATGIAASL